MISKTLLFGLLLLGSVQASAQAITDAARATAARDSLMRAVESIHAQLVQKTGFVLKTPNRKRRHLVSGNYITPRIIDAETGQKRQFVLWKHRTIYRRNGRIEEKYTAYQPGGLLLQERRLNGQIIWLVLSPRRSDAVANPLLRYARYIRGGYLLWNQRQYVLPTAVELK
ncbi:hypothetical protein [Hymenobacter terrestris]|uniref:Uncharacterized protein n=1 Tax=Hymenobacter terrestris TaxID=2748310 RepID=A0ABX2PZZ2_9BACT|nr:hypothetical protein [Hymenobacter terrestris]NVO83597.1 hypothetical protein [Hymenobacter terrestris]